MERIIFCTLLLCTAINSKPLAPSVESLNEIVGGNQRVYKDTKEIENVISSFSNDDAFNDVKKIENEKSSAEFASVQPTTNTSFTSSLFTTSSAYKPLAALLQPLTQRIQFSPQKFFTERLSQLKDALWSLGISIPHNFSLNQTIARQLTGTNGLIHISGLNDDGFYTDRLEPAGFFSGNGWFANKGGLLGGPGAILSTGSLLTDYPTPYKK